ncbi:MAG: DNA-binding protein [Deltaproteobacteria bacterium RIFCSPLOWO2_12_FULL_40_28]|nr:MAG: DNA-binding protein [Deltaproteobacteria bacterium RIFCSPHIGHO2_02_FULL_40_28]OGQ19267.1 MAG: DNA-binding protein [Deltaproteobacteria bacterium RIFCSPHIGHO2_12_FULL_40_32]OGQ40509.1 MAG: DNA-binding protein [Deltaproteobacteria bacterium RIFCSPLOWO2_02_FULL_40_36]OGQ53745.1 MAG: DNA-binding protein [Deltaproteobacteria bacterium RIFCSPLOWO2_12_FULL_40_28]
MPKSLISLEVIENEILLIRGQKVILDSTLAKLYGVTTKRLNEQVRRNKHRFPKDFMFQLIFQEVTILRSHFATSSLSWGGRRFLPNVFTEHGVIMAASILNTKRAIEVSVFVVRAFVKLRQMLATHKEMAHKLTELEKRLGTHDDAIRSLFNTIRQMMNPPEEKKQKIGFKVK